MTDAGPSNSPTPARRFDATDEQLSAELTKWTGGSPALHPVGELLDRHWEAAFAYARLCTDSARAAGMLTTAAFTRLFGASLRQSGPTAAWRPHLLVTVRRIAAEWDTDGRRDLLHPALRSDTDDGSRVAARLLPSADRRLLSRAFQRLSQSARCLLWHTEVEAEPLATPAALLGLDEEDARVELRRARERLRDECLQVHRELAPDDDCRRYHRLLDVTYRRGGIDLDPDLRAHLEQCRHCRHTAGQLDQFNGGGLGVALAEGVLGWGARAYLEARASSAERPAEAAAPSSEEFMAFPGEPFDSPGPAPEARGDSRSTDHADSGPGTRKGTRAGFRSGGRNGTRGDSDSGTRKGIRADSGSRARKGTRAGSRSGTGSGIRADFPTDTRPDSRGDIGPNSRTTPDGDTRPVPRRSDRKAARRARRRNLAAAVLTVSGLVVLPLVLWSALGSGDNDSSADGGEATEAPGSGAGDSTTDPSWAGAGDASRGTLRGRLHNVESGLCVGVAGTKAVQGAEVRLAACSSTASQQWTYETDGLLRNAAAPDLCLDSHLGYSLRLAPCTGGDRPGEKNVRYDFTLQGTLVPRWDQDLALAPAATDGSGALVLKNRVNDPAQRWVVDTSKPDPQMQAVNWGTDSEPATTPPSPTPTPKASEPPTPTPTPTEPRTTPKPTPTASPSTADPCSYNPYYCSGDNQYGGGPGGYGGYGYGGYGYGYGGYGGYGYGGR
ncbi:ricin-type beta-trefoil lectin domain protein [Streptomyces sp. NPDC002888]|uniref:RICIN domain-containing protein n=1 Tax=Streptomyces sp. NPDC002888 TaxID=3364668 RepID=UPI00367CD3A1